MPVWTPKFNTSFVGPIITNLLTYIRTNAPDALLWANGGSVQPENFAAIYNSRAAFEQEDFPDLMVDGVISTLSEKDDEGGVEQLHRIKLIFELKSPTAAALVLDPAAVGDPTELTIRQQVYMRALDSMCRKIPSSTLLSGVVGTQHCGTDVVSHDYGVHRGGGQYYFRQGALVFAVSMEETRNNAA